MAKKYENDKHKVKNPYIHFDILYSILAELKIHEIFNELRNKKITCSIIFKSFLITTINVRWKVVTAHLLASFSKNISGIFEEESRVNHWKGFYGAPTYPKLMGKYYV